MNSIPTFAQRLARSTIVRQGARAGLLIAIAGALVLWQTGHTETSFADGLRYIHQAERIEAGSWRDVAEQGTDHPLHPLLIAAMHRLMGGEGPASWQRAALWLSFSCTVLLVIPTYLLGTELFGKGAAWLACLLAMINPLSGYMVVNLLSESTFLLPWTFGLWAATRFLRVGRLAWVMVATGCGVLAYFTRPEGLLLAVALFVTLLAMPLFRSGRLPRRRCWAAIACVVIGVLVLAGPYIAMRGGLGTKPGIARVLALAPQSSPYALEREKPTAADESVLDTYQLAIVRMVKILRAAVTPVLFPFALLGLLRLSLRKDSAKAAVFLAIVLGASAIALVRLHATGGYGVTRHGAVPGILLTIAAAGALASLGARIRVAGRWVGLEGNRVGMGMAAAAGSALVGGLALVINARGPAFENPNPFAVYHATAAWLADHVKGPERVLDMTDWSLYLSRRRGYHFADVHRAPADPATRWVVVREPHVVGRWHYTEVIRELIGGREPVALIPARPAPGQLQIRIYDRRRESVPFVDRTAESSSSAARAQSLRLPGARSRRMEKPIPLAQSMDRESGS